MRLSVYNPVLAGPLAPRERVSVAGSSAMWNSAAANSMRDDVALECCVTFPGMVACLVDLLLQVRKVCLERRAKSA
jgi:hypothetical protein